MARREYTGVYAYTLAGGRVLYRTVFTDSNGVQRQKRGFKTATAAARFRAAMVVRAENGTLRTSHEPFSDHFDAWLANHHRASAGTRADYRRHGDRRLKPLFGTMRLSAIQVATVRSFVSEMAVLVDDGDIAAKTVNNALGCLSTCLKDAVALGKIASNPCDHVARLPEPLIERDWLRRTEIPRYLNACSTTYRPLAEVLIAIGVRISEALALRWDDIDLERSVIRVHRQSTAHGDSHTKSRRSRSVSIGERMLGLLRDLHASQAELHDEDPTRHHLFTTASRARKNPHAGLRSRATIKPIDRTTVSRDWHTQALTNAGLRDMPLHALRHTAAASWLLAGQPLIYVQRQLGHSSITTTEHFNGHLEQTFAHTAANATEATIWNTD